MTGFCRKHIGERTPAELQARYATLDQRGELTAGLTAEKARISDRLTALGLSTPDARPQPPSLLDFLDASRDDSPAPPPPKAD